MAEDLPSDPEEPGSDGSERGEEDSPEGTGPEDPLGGLGSMFGGLPFLGDLSKLLGQPGRINWDSARQIAYGLADEAGDPNVDPLVRMDIEQLARVADLQIAQVTGLSTSSTGAAVNVVPVTRTQWLARALDAYRPLFDSMAAALASASDDAPEPADPISAMVGQLMTAMAPTMLGMSAGGMLGHLANRSLGQYDLPIPRAPSDELLIVLGNLDRFAADWSLDEADVRLWACLHEIAHHAVLATHIGPTLEVLLREYAAGFRPDPTALAGRLEAIELSDLSDLSDLTAAFNDPEVVLGAVQTDAQRQLLDRISSLVAVVVGYVDHMMDRVGHGLISSYSQITEAQRRRRAEPDEASRFIERMLGLELTPRTYERGRRFADGVVERTGPTGLAPLLEDPRFLPTAAEVDAPGLWLARIDL